MLNNVLREVEVVGIFDHVEGRLASTGVTTKVDERFEIGDLVRVTVLSLAVDSLEKQSDRFLEAVGRCGLEIFDATRPVAVVRGEQLKSLVNGAED